MRFASTFKVRELIMVADAFTNDHAPGSIDEDKTQLQIRRPNKRGVKI